MKNEVTKIEVLISGDTVFVRLDGDCVAVLEKAEYGVQMGDGATLIVFSKKTTDYPGAARRSRKSDPSCEGPLLQISYAISAGCECDGRKTWSQRCPPRSAGLAWR
jgi:hypothetical protein